MKLFNCAKKDMVIRIIYTFGEGMEPRILAYLGITSTCKVIGYATITYVDIHGDELDISIKSQEYHHTFRVDKMGKRFHIPNKFGCEEYDGWLEAELV